MPEKSEIKIDIKCKCGKTTKNVDAEPAKMGMYVKVTRFVCECGIIFHIYDHFNAITTYMSVPSDIDDKFLAGQKKDKDKKQEISKEEISKKCYNHCPNCGACIRDIDWGPTEGDMELFQTATCKKCGCDFTELHTYNTTIFTVGHVKRIPCPAPMNQFYNYMDEVPDGTRVSTPEDCEKCEDKNCFPVKHCLIGG